MPLRLVLFVLVCTLAAGGKLWAQNRVRTEVIRPPAVAQPQTLPGFGGIKFKATGHIVKPDARTGAELEISNDLSRLPPAVARTRERIVAAARSGELHQLVAVMEASEPPPVFSFRQDKAPITFWKTSYPESEGVEILAIVLSILETGFVHVEQGTPEDVFVWPYFARLPLKQLAPQQKVELFRIVTGADYQGMLESGAYSFYRLGIAPDGTWMFLVSGD
jgi:hypothetical protein